MGFNLLKLILSLGCVHDSRGPEVIWTAVR